MSRDHEVTFWIELMCELDCSSAVGLAAAGVGGEVVTLIRIAIRAERALPRRAVRNLSIVRARAIPSPSAWSRLEEEVPESMLMPQARRYDPEADEFANVDDEEV